MKLAILFPGYLDSPDYLHLKIFSASLKNLGYVTEIIDPCGLWKTNNIKNYSVTNYLKDIKAVIDSYKDQQPEEIILIGHSLGGFVAILAGNLFPQVTKIIALCPPASIDRLGSKWVNKSPRISKRDLPEDPTKFRNFEIPYSFVEDAQKYSAIDSVKKITKPLMILIGLDDKSIPQEETETLVSNANHPHVVKMPGIGHNFRHSATECNIVMSEIQDFLLSH
jgi:pimeloyl-ACP methyl ester carboxylesterase